MIGCHLGETAKIEVFKKDQRSTDCIIHRENISSKKPSFGLNNVMSRAVKIFDDIRCRALHSRLFQALWVYGFTILPSLVSCRNKVAFEKACSYPSFRVEKESSKFLCERNFPLEDFYPMRCKLANSHTQRIYSAASTTLIVLFKDIASTYSYCTTKRTASKRSWCFRIDMRSKAILICFYVCKTVWQVHR